MKLKNDETFRLHCVVNKIFSTNSVVSSQQDSLKTSCPLPSKVLGNNLLEELPENKQRTTEENEYTFACNIEQYASHPFLSLKDEFVK